jgi:uncharacterized membrane protein
VVVAVALVTVAGIILTDTDHRPTTSGIDLPDAVHPGVVRRVELAPCAGTGPDGPECRAVVVELTGGPDRGETRLLEYGLEQPESLRLHTGDRVVLNHFPENDERFDYQLADRQRRPTLYLLAGLFAIAVVMMGRWRGLAALGGLIVSIAVIVRFSLPAVLAGGSPIVVAVLSAIAIAYCALYLAHGFNALTSVALLGTVGALAITVFLSWLFSNAANFTGLASDDAGLLQTLVGEVDIVGLLLAGTVIGALGALDDMTVTQASAVAELHAANPLLPARQLYVRGMRIGRDHISSTVNTLALAYVGASLPTFLIFAVSAQSLGTIANSETVAVEIVRTLVGSIGLVAAVPITTALAAFVVGAGLHERAAPNRGREPRAPRPRPARATRSVPPDADTAATRSEIAPISADEDFWSRRRRR